MSTRRQHRAAAAVVGVSSGDAAAAAMAWGAVRGEHGDASACAAVLRALHAGGGACSLPRLRDRWGNGLLHVAAAGGHTDVCTLLLRVGCDVRARGAEGCTPLLAASRGGYAVTVRALLDGGACVNACDEEGTTPLHAAVTAAATRGDFPDAAHVLLLHGADVNCVNARGETALHIAVRHACVHAVTALLDAGANARVRDAGGVTVYDLVRRVHALGHVYEDARKKIAHALQLHVLPFKSKRAAECAQQARVRGVMAAGVRGGIIVM